MIYPEIPKSKRKSSYIVGGIFAIFAGIILLMLFLPKFTDKILGFVLWDWSTILPSISPDFFLNVALYVQIVMPVVLFLCVVSSFFMGLSKSSMFLKISIACSTFAYLLRYSLTPANLTTNIINALTYVQYALIALSLVFIILGIIFRCKKDEVYVPYHANSFHIFSSIALFVISAIDIFSSLLKLDVITSNSRYYYSAIIALFLITAGIWMLCSSKRDPSEFGTGYSREYKTEQQPAVVAPTENTLNEQNVNTQTNAQNVNAPQPQQVQPQPQAQPQPQVQPQTQIVLSDGRPVQQTPPMPQANPNLQVVGERPTAPTPNLSNINNPQAQNVRPPMPNGAMPPRPAMPPRIGPDGRPLPPFPPRPANMPPRVGPDGRPLPPFPPRPANMPPQNPNMAHPQQHNNQINTTKQNQNNTDKGE